MVLLTIKSNVEIITRIVTQDLSYTLIERTKENMLLEIVPYSNVIVGLLVFFVGFIFHWVGQLAS